MKPAKLLIRAAVILLLTHACFAQSPPFRNFTSEDGLLNTNIFSVFQSSGGFIWIGTENGISRFDGTNFKNYTIADGIPGGEVLSLGEMEDSSIAIIIQRKPVALLKHGKLRYLHVPYSINGLSTFMTYTVCKGNKIYGYDRSRGMTVIDTEKDSVKTVDFKPYKIISIKAGALIAGGKDGLYTIEDGNPVKLGVIDKPIHNLFEDAFQNLWAVSYNNVYKIRDYRITDSFSVHENDTIIIKDFIVDRNEKIYFNFPGSNTFVYSKGRYTPLDKLVNISDSEITSLLMDNEGNAWFGTIGKGVFCVYNSYIKNYTGFTGLQNNYVRALAMDGPGRVYIGTYNGINILENDSLFKINFNIPLPSYMYVYDIIEKSGNELIVLTTGMSDERYKDVKLRFFDHPSLLPMEGNRYIGGYWSFHITTFTYNSGIKTNITGFRLPEKNAPDRINKIYMSGKGVIYAGAISGLYILNDTSAEKVESIDILNQTVYDIKEDWEGRIWVATDKGAAVFNGKEWKGMENISGNSLAVCRSLAFDSVNRVWIGCLSGLYIYDEKNNIVKKFNQNSGLTSNNITCLYFNGKENEMVIGTNAGLSVFSINDYNAYPPVNIKPYIKSFTARDSAFYMGAIDIPHNMNNLKISYSTVHFREKDLLYRYRFAGENKWIETGNTEVELLSLNPGSYSFELGVRSLNGEWSEPLLLDFVIQTPFYKSVYFYAAVAIGVVFSASAFSRYRVNKIKKAERKKRLLSARINELKQYALTTGMMNPHFIFNSLNSIQHFINSSNTREAGNYLAKFSRLIRMNIDSAFTSFTPLNTELERLEMYLALELLRFGKKLSYCITVDKKIDKDLLNIPNMIIQPFVENSIWHGILPLEAGGHITISIFYENTFLKIVVKDNGVGLEHKKNNDETPSHLSKGMKIVKERLRLLSTKENPGDILKIYSNHTLNPAEAGTSVEITLNGSLYRINKAPGN